ncbi:MAG: hypothetical protein EXS10_06945 [Phycisphaerales bacterium]|nr:hypothetical protein [Phycisphaerales bacterium]
MNALPHVSDGRSQLRAQLRARCIACRTESPSDVRVCPRCSKANELYCGACMRVVAATAKGAICSHCLNVAQSVGDSVRARIATALGSPQASLKELTALRERFASLRAQFSLPPRVGAFVAPVAPDWEKVAPSKRASLRSRFDEVMVTDAQVRREVESALRSTINFDVRIEKACDSAESARAVLVEWDGLLVGVRDQALLDAALNAYADGVRGAKQMLERLKERDLSRALDLDAARARALAAFKA